MTRLLFISDDSETGRYLSDVLDSGGFEIKCVREGLEAITDVPVFDPEVIVIELLAPEMNAMSLCRYLREAYSIPIVACSTSGREADIVRTLDAGADDYVVMPVRPIELTARLRAVVRRANGDAARQSKDRLAAGDVHIRLDEHRAYRGGMLLDLSPTEFRLLVCLVRQAGRVVSHSKLIAQVWGSEYVSCRHYLRLYVRYLRAKIEDEPEKPELILSDWGVGYRFQPAAS